MPLVDPHERRLEEGWLALSTGSWEEAHAVFELLAAERETPEALDGLGAARWWLGDPDGGLELRKRAVARYRRQGKCSRAAELAVWISHQHLIAGRPSAAGGWLARADRALAGVERCAGHGWVAVERARRASDPEEVASHARVAMEIAQESGDADLEVFALSLLGRSEVRAGRHRDGMHKLDESMAAATAGEVRSFNTLGEAYCNMLAACAIAGDWERAAEWCEFVDEFSRRHKCSVLLWACRTIHADVLVSTGQWPAAEDALETALGARDGFYRAMAGPALATLAELRVRQGRLAEAEQLLAGREEQPRFLRAVAALMLARGEAEAAAEHLTRGLELAGMDLLAAARLLGPQVEALIALPDAAGAAQAAARLEEVAIATELKAVRAAAALARSRVALLEGRRPRARDAARRALNLFSELGMPLDAGEARLELALALDPPEVAREEARTALRAFRDLGAARAMDAAAAVLRELGGGTAAGPRTSATLTRREDQVLELLALGMSNAEIGDSLFITEKTAGHHVSRILAKLGVRNRVEAATLASRLSGPAAVDIELASE